MVTLIYNILFPRRFLELKGSLAYEPSEEDEIPQLIIENEFEDNEKDNEMVPMKVHIRVPSHILEIDGCRADALDFFTGGSVIAYHKQPDRSFA